MQIVLSLAGPIDAETLEAAADALVNRHQSLRAGFQHEHLDRPIQVLYRQSSPLAVYRSSCVGHAERERRLTQFVTNDRAERFDSTSAPLVRFALVRLAAEDHRLVLTNHHIVMDGWSVPVLLQELLGLYAQGADAAALPRAGYYRDYLAWLALQDRTAAISAWREALTGVDEPNARCAGRLRQSVDSA